jgi:thioredoxin reductase (NADPH)
VTVFMEGGADALAHDAHERLQQAQIEVAAEAVSSMRLSGGRITVVHGAHESVCDSLYCALGLEIHNRGALQLGAACDEEATSSSTTTAPLPFPGCTPRATWPRASTRSP